MYRVVQWNTELLAGDAFYFPGSRNVDTNDRAKDHNNKPPAFIILEHVNADRVEGRNSTHDANPLGWLQVPDCHFVKPGAGGLMGV